MLSSRPRSARAFADEPELREADELVRCEVPGAATSPGT
jgi:hypothetical protein